MRGFAALVRKEVRSYLNSPIAYIVVVGFLLFTSVRLFVLHDFFAADIASLRAYYGVMPIVFIVLIPAITMRAWAEEVRSGTDEVLLTLPVGESTLVLAKYTASLALVVIAIALTAVVPVSVRRLGDFERGEIVGQYLGLLLLAGSGIAVGQFISALSRNQISAFIFTALTLLFLTLIGEVNAVADPPVWVSRVLNYLSFDAHFRGFNRGILDTRDLFYFLGVTVLFLLANVRVLRARKMR